MSPSLAPPKLHPLSKLVFTQRKGGRYSSLCRVNNLFLSWAQGLLGVGIPGGHSSLCWNPNPKRKHVEFWQYKTPLNVFIDRHADRTNCRSSKGFDLFLSLISWVGFPAFPIGIWIRRVHFSILHTLLTNKVCQLHHHSKKKKNYTTIQNRVCLVGPSCWGAGWSGNWKAPLISSYSHLHVNNISEK